MWAPGSRWDPPGWLSLHRAEEGTSHCSAGFGNHNCLLIKLLRCPEPSSHPSLTHHPEVSPTGHSWLPTRLLWAPEHQLLDGPVGTSGGWDWAQWA